jgi:hypothetical protein
VDRADEPTSRRAEDLVSVVEPGRTEIERVRQSREAERVVGVTVRVEGYGAGGGGSAGVSARHGARHSAASQPSVM